MTSFWTKQLDGDRVPSGSGGADLAALTGSLLPTAMVSWQIGLGDAFLLVNLRRKTRNFSRFMRNGWKFEMGGK